MKKYGICLLALVAMIFFLAPDLWAAGLHERAEESGKTMAVFWALPFAGMLLSIALGPLAAPHFWNHHFGKVAIFWSLAFLIPYAVFYGTDLACYTVLHTFFQEYLSFLILLFVLFTIAGGVRVTGSLAGTPQINTLILLIGGALASWMGTTGAAMLLIRPLIRALEHRQYKAHTIVFFIFLVANIGGCLTPLGDPPLFLGFLKGVSFFWTTKHLIYPLLIAAAVLLVLYFCLDSYFYKKESKSVAVASGDEEDKLGLEGKFNLLLLLCVVCGTLASGIWKPGQIEIYHVEIELQNVARDIFFLIIAGISLKTTPEVIRRRNEFNWEPIAEVAKLFAGIFVTMAPAIAILRAGSEGALKSLIGLVTTNGVANNKVYFWLTGVLSSFLDNAPTYVVFFNTAGGNAGQLMSAGATTLLAISMGAVFMGANTYIGNAPNFMVRSIAESSGVKMPSFFGYMAWSCCILLPIFLVLTFIFF